MGCELKIHLINKKTTVQKYTTEMNGLVLS